MLKFMSLLYLRYTTSMTCLYNTLITIILILLVYTRQCSSIGSSPGDPAVDLLRPLLGGAHQRPVLRQHAAAPGLPPLHQGKTRITCIIYDKPIQ